MWTILLSLDIMPTLANLFGLDYDSRLVMGRDILSDSDALVISRQKLHHRLRALYSSRIPLPSTRE
jgi:phosphoglycerol transferase MdoB-like AlkP superfamily enzyme